MRYASRPASMRLQVRKRLLEEYNIEIGGGLGPFAGKIWRIGLMGESSTPNHVNMLLAALKRSDVSFIWTKPKESSQVNRPPAHNIWWAVWSFGAPYLPYLESPPWQRPPPHCVWRSYFQRRHQRPAGPQ